jgi:hypothetical protein
VALQETVQLAIRASEHGCSEDRSSLSKLFIDQAVPSAGINGTVVLARGLELRGVPLPVAALLRVVGVVPGGLGTFEAASIVTLKLAGGPVAVALSATLAYRVLSFWLPMLPGLFFSHSATRRPVRV